MASSYTASARFNLQGTGDNLNTWGAILNSGVFQLVDTAIAGRLAFTLSGSKTLTTANGVTDEARNAILDVTSGTGGTVIVPSVSKPYVVRNGSAGNVTLTTGGVTTAVLATGDILPVFTDGSAVYQLMLSGLTLRDFITAAVLGATGSLPAAAGNAGRYLYSDGSSWFARQVSTSDLSDYNTLVLGVQVALAVAL